MTLDLPLKDISNPFGIATLSLGTWREHKLETRLKAASTAGFKWIDLFDEDWAAYLEENGLDGKHLWEATDANLKVAKQLGDLVKSLGMQIACTQPCRNVEGIKDQSERKAAFDGVTKRFPFMRAFDTDLVFLCANTRTDGVTSDFRTVAKDLAELGDLAAAYASKDEGRMLRVGYEGLSWGIRNTWSSTWEVVRAANRDNVGLILDSFNILAVEFADPYNPAGHGRIYSTLDESISVLRSSMKELALTVPGEKIFFCQLADAEKVDPKEFLPPEDKSQPILLPWSRSHRLYPCEEDRGGYMPVHLVGAAILATGYSGPLSLEVFNKSLNRAETDVPDSHAKRGITGLKKLRSAIQETSL